MVMTFFDPNTLFDVGFQLSFMATLGLMIYAKPFARSTHALLERLFNRDWARQLVDILNDALLVTWRASHDAAVVDGLLPANFHGGADRQSAGAAGAVGRHDVWLIRHGRGPVVHSAGPDCGVDGVAIPDVDAGHHRVVCAVAFRVDSVGLRAAVAL